MKNKLLLGQCYKRENFSYTEVFKHPAGYRDYLLETYPDIKPWINDEMFANLYNFPTGSFSVERDSTNIAGHFIRVNLKTYAKVIDEPLTVSVLEKELEENSYTHVGIGIYVDSYSEYIKCSGYIRKNYPKIKIIGGNVGAMFEGAEQYADHICIGDGVQFFRKMFDEPIDNPYVPEIFPHNLYAKVAGRRILRPMAMIVPQIGCPHKCSFCVTNRYFQGYCSGNLFTPGQVYEAMVKHREKIGMDYSLQFAVPTAVTSLNWWYELFALFRNEPGDYPLIFPTTIPSLKKMDIRKITNSSLRFDIVNIGVESIREKYGKDNTDLLEMKKLIKEYSEHGIGLYISYIFGFDYTTHQSIREEIDILLELEAMMIIVQTLHVLPGTPVWDKLKKENRLLDVPNDFFFIPGFLAFKHPHLKSGFDDMMPIMNNTNKYLERREGPTLGRIYQLMKKLIDSSDIKKPEYSRNLKNFKIANMFSYPIWKHYLKPEKIHQRHYEERSDISQLQKLITDIPGVAKMISAFMARS